MMDDRPPRNYSDRMVPAVEALLDRYADKDPIEFELMFAFGALQPGQGPAFHALLILTMPSPVLGQVLCNFTQFLPAGLADEGLDRIVREAVELLRQERTKALGSILS